MAARSLAICLCIAAGAPATASGPGAQREAPSCSGGVALDEFQEDEVEVHGVHLLQAKRELVPPAPVISEQRGPGEKAGAVDGSQGKTVAIKDVYSVVLELAIAKLNSTAEDVDNMFRMLDKDGDGNIDEVELRFINRSYVDAGAVAPLNSTSESLTAPNASLTQSMDWVTFLSSEIGSRIYNYR